MAQSKAKKFEALMKEQWLSTVPNSVFYRLYDTTSGFKSIANVADFLGYKYPLMFIIDAKTKKGNTIGFSDIRQYSKMLEYKNIKGVFTGIICWFYEHENKIVWIPIQTLEKIEKEGKKSFNVKMIDDNNYECYVIPSKKIRTFYQTDYSKFVEYCEHRFLEGDIDESRD